MMELEETMKHSLLACFAAVALLLTAPLLCSFGPKPKSVPVLILPDPPAECVCAASVVGSQTSTISTCIYNNVAQNCFTAQIEGSSHTDTPGVCLAAAQVEPPRIACGPKVLCTYEPRVVRIVAAVCVGQGSCGTPNYQGYDAAGQAVGEVFGAQGETKITVSIGNRPCNSSLGYVVHVKDNNGNDGASVVFSYKVEAFCAQCSRLLQ